MFAEWLTSVSQQLQSSGLCSYHPVVSLSIFSYIWLFILLLKTVITLSWLWNKSNVLAWHSQSVTNYLHLIFSPPKPTSIIHFNHLFNKYIKPLYLLGTAVFAGTKRWWSSLLNFKLIGALSKRPEHRNPKLLTVSQRCQIFSHHCGLLSLLEMPFPPYSCE